MWGLLNAATAPIKSAAYQFARNQAAAAARKTGLDTVRTLRRSPVGSPEENLARLKLSLNTPVFQGASATLGGLTAVDVSNRTGFTGQIEGTLNRAGPALDQLFSGTPQAIQQFGKEQEKKGWGGALEMAAPLGFLAAPFIPNTRPSSKTSGARPVGTQAVLNGKPVYWGGNDYGWQQLNQRGSSATLGSLNTPGTQGRFVQEQGFRPIGGTPAERAQAAETSRVAQLTAQDPELQRYEKARAAAKTQEEMNAARDIGMQIWQEKYGKTPMAQPGGAVGVTNPLMQRTFGYQTGSAPGQQIGEPTLGPSPLVPQIDQSLNPASPNYIGGEGSPLMDFTREDVSPEVIAAYQKQLLEQAATGRK